MGTVGSICQFEGFRKVRRIAAGQTKPFRFEADGFLDPFSDPTEEDKVLWTKPTKKGNNIEFFLSIFFVWLKIHIVPVRKELRIHNFDSIYISDIKAILLLHLS